MLEAVTSWATRNVSIRGLILTGSKANPTDKTDLLSDYDIAVFGHNFDFIKNDKWLSYFGEYWVCIHDKFDLAGKEIPTALVIFSEGIKFDFSFHPVEVITLAIAKEKLPDAITSPAGTADTMEIMSPVKLELKEIKKIVESEGGCIAWGGAVRLSPADDIIIRVERALDIDSEGQMVASVLSKKAAAGSTHVVIDIPVGETAKVRSQEEAARLSDLFEQVGIAIGLKVKVLITNGSQPIGRGIGPALEAKDILSVLRNEENAPRDLKEKSLMLASALLEFAGKSKIGNGYSDSKIILESGRALRKFKSICVAQGGFKEPAEAPIIHPIIAEKSGVVTKIDNRKLSRIAKLAGAPDSPTAGIRLISPLRKEIEKGDLLFEIHSESSGALHYALDYLRTENHVITLQ